MNMTDFIKYTLITILWPCEKNDGREFNSKRVHKLLPQIFIFKTEYRYDRVSNVCMTE